MGVGSGAWWPSWVGWLLWGVTALAVLVTVGVLVVAWRIYREDRSVEHSLGVPVYLDAAAVVNIMSSLGLRPVPQGITLREVRAKDRKIEVRGVAAGMNDTTEETRQYQEVHEPIDLVTPLLKALSDRRQLVLVDLVGRRLWRNRAVDRHLRSSGRRGDTTPLWGGTAYVSLVGMFRMESEDDGSTVFLAPIGEPGGGGDVPHVRLECPHEWLLDRVVPDGEFFGSCLGRVRSWQPEEGHLVVRPIAVFQ
ncbi:hypothetical protein [Saccharothrix syringae]|uniref:hypothetical protein n=1 Tax=Saccharothrix syringae TaxID=103733 RepID=UPI00052685D9|nr:hypothetical protein [Saccharothrix syringae]